MNETIEQLLKHRSVRDYIQQPVPLEIQEQIIACAQMAPSSSNIQAYSIISVTDPVIREGIKAVSGGQRWVKDAPLLYIFCADLYRPKKYFKTLDPVVLGNTELFTIAVVDTALAAQKALIAAQSLGLGGVIVGGIRNDVAKVSELLHLPKLVFPVFALCLGYPAVTPDLKPRLPQSVILKHEEYYLQSEEDLVNQYDQEMQQYYAARESGTHSESWSDRCGQLITDKRRDEVDCFLKKAGFLQQQAFQ